MLHDPLLFLLGVDNLLKLILSFQCISSKLRFLVCDFYVVFTCKRLALLVFVGGFSRVRHMFGLSRWAGFRKAELQVAYKAVEHRRRQQRESINRDPLIRGLIVKINKNRVGLEVI